MSDPVTNAGLPFHLPACRMAENNRDQGSDEWAHPSSPEPRTPSTKVAHLLLVVRSAATGRVILPLGLSSRLRNIDSGPMKATIACHHETGPFPDAHLGPCMLRVKDVSLICPKVPVF